VTDPDVGSVFIYDATLLPVAELGGLATPLGVAVAPSGAIYVGCKGTKSVEVYNPRGDKVAAIGAGAIQMPNDLALDRDGKLYVADSKANVVKVYSPAGAFLGDLGFDSNEGDMLFPSAVAVAYRIDLDLGIEVGELYVADQGHSRIRVYDLAGTLLRVYGAYTPAFFGNWKGKFARLQSLAVDALGQVHAADCYMNKVQVLDSLTGAYIRDYGAFGTGQGQLNVPLDILLTTTGRMVVANSGNHRVETISTGP
jgi:DNA-binding beta-propeller fold protein YncE